MELKKIQSVLQDAEIEIDLNTLQNPSEEFMIYLITEYMTKFYIDGNEIAKPTPEQLDCVSCEESTLNAIKAINLHAALAAIGDGIFLTGFTLTDITNPSYKKTCKRIKVLFNFFVYVRTKKVEKLPLFCEMESRQQEIEDIIQHRAELAARIGSVIHERESKLEYIEKLKKEISDLQLQMKNDEKVRRKLQHRVDEVTTNKQELLDKFNAIKRKAHELHKETKNLLSKIVECPKEYMTRSKELKKMLKEKMEERQTVNDSINRKKNQIRDNELAEADVKKCYSKTVHVGEIMQKLKETSFQINAARKQLNDLKEEIVLLEHKPSDVRNTFNSLDAEDVLEKSQQLLSELHNSQVEKQREHETLKVKLQELQNEHGKLTVMLQKETETILVAESDYLKVLNGYKSYFTNEIFQEIDLNKNLKQLQN